MTRHAPAATQLIVDGSGIRTSRRLLGSYHRTARLSPDQSGNRTSSYQNQLFRLARLPGTWITSAAHPGNVQTDAWSVYPWPRSRRSARTSEATCKNRRVAHTLRLLLSLHFVPLWEFAAASPQRLQSTALNLSLDK